MVNENIKLLRKYNALDAYQLAFALRIDEEDYFTLEDSSVIPEARELEKIARIYNITMDQLFFGMDRFGKPLCQSETSADEFFRALSEGNYLSSLSKKEQNMIIAYRLCDNKAEAYDKIRTILDQCEPPQNSEMKSEDKPIISSNTSGVL